MKQPKMSRLTLLLGLFGLICNQVSGELATEAIIGGSYVKKAIKYQVALRTNGRNHCGGTIIDTFYVLTAAHCVTNERGIRMEPLQVVAGTKDLRDQKHSIVVPVETIYIHKNFDRTLFQNDIAILKLSNKLKKGLNMFKTVEKINLPSGSSNYDGVKAVASGFGLQQIRAHKDRKGEWIELGGSTDERLKHIDVHVISRDKCLKMNGRQPVAVSEICGQVSQHDKHHYAGVCTGDSGGPLVHKNEIIGIISKTPNACDETKKTAIYTRVSSYLPLIHRVLAGKPSIMEVKWKDIPQ